MPILRSELPLLLLVVPPLGHGIDSHLFTVFESSLLDLRTAGNMLQRGPKVSEDCRVFHATSTSEGRRSLVGLDVLQPLLTLQAPLLL